MSKKARIEPRGLPMGHALDEWEKHAILWVTAHMCDHADFEDLDDTHIVSILRREGYSNVEINQIGEGMEDWVVAEFMPTDLTPPQITALKCVVQDSELVHVERVVLPAYGTPSHPDKCRAGLRALAAKLEQRGVEITRIAN